MVLFVATILRRPTHVPGYVQRVPSEDYKRQQVEPQQKRSNARVCVHDRHVPQCDGNEAERHPPFVADSTEAEAAGCREHDHRVKEPQQREVQSKSLVDEIDFHVLIFLRLKVSHEPEEAAA